MATSTITSPRPPPSLFLISILSLSLYLSVAMDTNLASATTNDHPETLIALNPRSGSRFLATNIRSAKNGDYCDPSAKKSCSGAKGGGAGQRRLKCCGKKCTDLRTSRSNCGACGRRCGFGQLCCKGKCRTVAYDVKNCGGCGVACRAGLRCTYGMCGYA